MGSRPMLDVNLLRERPEVIRENLVKRGDTARLPVLENAIRWDREWREGQRELDGLAKLHALPKGLVVLEALQMEDDGLGQHLQVQLHGCPEAATFLAAEVVHLLPHDFAEGV